MRAVPPYAGYASTMLNPEPYAYEGALAVRKLIQDQIKGDERLRYESNGSGSAVAPLLKLGGSPLRVGASWLIRTPRPIDQYPICQWI